MEGRRGGRERGREGMEESGRGNLGRRIRRKDGGIGGVKR